MRLCIRQPDIDIPANFVKRWSLNISNIIHACCIMWIAKDLLRKVKRLIFKQYFTDNSAENVIGYMLWLSTDRSNCHFNCATFRLPWIRSLHSPSKNFFLFSNVNSLGRQHSERAHGERNVAQLKRQQILSLDSQNISIFLLS